MSKSAKNEIDEEKFLEDIFNKGNKFTPEEKEKIFKYLLILYEKYCKKGNKPGYEVILEKLVIYIVRLGENDRNFILEKFHKKYPKYEEYYKKLFDLIMKRLDDKNKSNKKKTDKKLLDSAMSKDKSSSHKDLFNSYGKSKSKKNLKSGKGGTNSSFKDNNISFGGGHNDVFGNFGIGRLSYRERLSSRKKNRLSDSVEVRDITPLKFDGMFLDISKYITSKREKNPFEGPSPFDRFYRIRRTKIREKIFNMVNEDIKDNRDDN